MTTPLNREDYLSKYKDTLDSALNKKVYLSPVNLSSLFIPVATFKVLVVASLSMIPGVGGLISNIVYTIFTYLDERNANEEANVKKDEDIKLYMQIANQIVDNKIDNYDYNSLSQLFVKCKNALKVYHDSIDVYRSNKTVLNKSQMQSNYSALLKTLLDSAVDSQKKDYQVQELPFYSIFITSYLLLLREGILNKKELGYDDANVQIFQSYFDTTISASKSYCEQVYNLGLDKVKNNKQIYQVDEFNNIMKYRNCMITSCFDFVAIWQFLNPTIYPKNLNFEYCRYLFTPAYGYPYVSELDIMKRDDYLNVISNNNFEFYQKELGGFKIGYSTRIANIQTYFWNANEPNKTITGQKFGGADTGLTFAEYSGMNNYVDPVHIESANFPTKLGFKGYSDVSFTPGMIGGEGISPDIKIIPYDVKYPCHKLGNFIGYYVRSKVNNGIIGSLGFAFAHESTFSANVVSPNSYNVFNSQKTRGMGNTLKLDKDAYTIGTHGVVFGPNVTATYQIYHPGQSTTSDQLDYNVWLMVKSDVDFSIAFQLFNQDGTSYSSLGQFKGTGQSGVIQTIKKNASNINVKISLTLNQPVIKFNLLNKFETNVTLINIILVPVAIVSN